MSSSPPGDAESAPRWRRRATVVMLVVLTVAAALRLHGLDWDAGQHLHPDERFLTMVETAIEVVPAARYFDTATSSLNPANRGHRFFVYGTFPLFLVRYLAELFGAVDYARIHLLGRAVSALFDVGTVWLTFRLGVLAAGARTGLAAAVLVALCPLAIQHAHFFTVDSAAAFWTTAALLALLHAARRPAWRWHVAFGIAFGVALACRINVLLLAPFYPLALAHAWRRGHLAARGGIVASAVAFGIAALAFRVLQPYAFAGPGFFDVALAPGFIDSLATVRAYVTGAADFPPSVQWIGRPRGLFAATNVFGWGLGPAWGLTAIAGLAWCLASRRASTVARIAASWAALLFVYHASQFAATGRYFLPIVSVLALAAVLPLSAGERPGRVRLAILSLVLVLTALWGTAFTAIYRRPHTRVEASQWLHENVAPRAVIATEHWDDALPLGLEGRSRERFRFVELALYAEEDDRKRRELTERLDAADWIVISSNRLYRSIPRAPWRYPLARRYYELLFTGELGFRLERVFTSFPRLGPLEIDDSGAEEQFTVHDHPTVLVFRKTTQFARGRVEALFDAVSLESIVRAPPREASALYRARRPLDVPLPIDPRVRTPVAPGPTTSAGALVRWLLGLEALSLACWALLAPLMRGTPDAGFGLAKVLAWLAPAYALWLAASLGVVPHAAASARALGAGLLVLGALAAWVWRADLGAVVTRRWRALAAVEAVFLAAFVVFAVARALNPAVAWGEKPMDFAILNALLRTRTLPPPDPWFAGETLNYSYFGHAVVASHATLAGVPAALAFNVAVPTVAALLAITAYLAAQRLAGSVRAGLLGACAVTLVGNLAGPYLLVRDPARVIDFHYYWATSRVIEGTINEFPAWNLLFGDLHAHVMAQPVLVALVYLAALWTVRHDEAPSRPAVAALAAWCLGALVTTSPWSAPTGAAVLLAAVLVTWRTRPAAWGRLAALVGGWTLALAGAVATFAPFWARYRPSGMRWGFEQQQAPLLGVAVVFGVLAVATVPALALSLTWRRRTADVLGIGAAAVAVGAIAVARSPAAAAFAAAAILGAVTWWRLDDVRVRMSGLLVAVAGAIGVATETVYVWDRMNTVFKFYLDAWLLLGCAAGALVPLAAPAAAPRWRRVWLSALVVVAAAGVFTTASGALGLLRFPPITSGRPTLDGMRYLREHAPGEFEALAWLNRDVPGVPVVLEAHGPPYQQFSRVSMNTGLPTVLGWEYHLVQQGRPPGALAERRDDVRTLFATTDGAVANRLMAKYGVDLVFVGPLERRTYPMSGLAKFEREVTEPVFRHGDVTVYARPGAVHGLKTWIEPVHVFPPAADLAAPGTFSEPRGIARAPDGTLVVADFGHKRLQRVGDGGDIRVIGRPGSGPGEFRDPCDVAVGRDGALYVADTWNHRVQKLSPRGEFVAEWRAGFYGPRGVAVARNGSLYVTDTGNNRVVHLASDGRVLGSWGHGELLAPVGIAVLGDEIFVADSGRRRIAVFSAAGALRRQWSVDGWADGTLKEPYLDVATDGTVWVTDPGGHRVLLYSSAGRLLGTAAPEADLDTPLGIAVIHPARAVVTTRDGRLVTVARPTP